MSRKGGGKKSDFEIVGMRVSHEDCVIASAAKSSCED